MKNFGKITSSVTNQTYMVVVEVDNFGPTSVIAWRNGAEPIEFTFDACGFTDPLLNEINDYVLSKAYDGDKMPSPEDFPDAVLLPA